MYAVNPTSEPKMTRYRIASQPESDQSAWRKSRNENASNAFTMPEKSISHPVAANAPIPRLKRRDKTDPVAQLNDPSTRTRHTARSRLPIAVPVTIFGHKSAK